jgi:hypothetical protein
MSPVPVLLQHISGVHKTRGNSSRDVAPALEQLAVAECLALFAILQNPALAIEGDLLLVRAAPFRLGPYLFR